MQPLHGISSKPHRTQILGRQWWQPLYCGPQLHMHIAGSLGLPWCPSTKSITPLGSVDLE